MLRQHISILLLMGLGAALFPAPVHAAKSTAADANRTAAGNTHFMIFNAPPAGTYDVRVGGTPQGSVTAGPQGSFEYRTSTTAGQLVEFIFQGANPVTPGAPTGFAASGTTQGCVNLSWNTPPAGDYVSDYSLLWGTSPGVYTDSVAVGRLEVIKSGGTSRATKCGFPSGTFHFALRAHNSFDLWSGLSNPATASITNDNTVGPPAPTNVAASETPLGCAKVTWNASSDPTVTGYRVYLGTRPRSQGAYTDSTDVGQVTTGSICSLSPGTYYLAVRAFTGPGVFSAYSKEVSLNVFGPDVTPPVVSSMSPANGATNVPRNATVFFIVSDARSGVNNFSISVQINGQQWSLVATPATGGYAVQATPAGLLPANSTIQVQVSAQDGASPPNAVAAAWSFTTGADAVNDIDPPVISSPSPAADAVDVPAAGDVSVTISDAGLGVDLGSIVMVVDGTEVATSVDGTPASVRVTYHPESPFELGRTIRVQVEACDRAATPNCATPFVFSFTVGNAALSAWPGAIVPDGFWANDPARPMEVRNLPLDWNVRIFDTSGTPVRRFANTQAGQTWQWDFRNDHGVVVAPALYLVRVTDGSGAVKETGRFLVQSAR